MNAHEDARWLAAAARIATRGRPLSRPNPAVGALIVRDGIVRARGWTQPDGRPHAEAVALAMAGAKAAGATLYVTLEPCAHASARGPACADLAAASPITRVVIACEDSDPRTAGGGIARLRAAGKQVDVLPLPVVRQGLAGYFTRQQHGRPHVTLKLALSLDGCIAMADGSSRWITGAAARAHGHVMRAMADAILVGGETLRRDSPRLDVRLLGLETRSPQRWVLTRGAAPPGWRAIAAPTGITTMTDVAWLLIEGGAATAAAFLAADLVDRLLIYRAPIIIGGGRRGVDALGLANLDDAHGRWQMCDERRLGSDTLSVYDRMACSPASSPL